MKLLPLKWVGDEGRAAQLEVLQPPGIRCALRLDGVFVSVGPSAPSRSGPQGDVPAKLPQVHDVLCMCVSCIVDNDTFDVAPFLAFADPHKLLP